MYVRPLKPNLLDTKLTMKLDKTLDVPKSDCWLPAKKDASNLYSCIIKPNIIFFIVGIFILIFLVYRYRLSDQEKRDRKRAIKKREYTKKDRVTDQVADIITQYYDYNKTKMEDDKITDELRRDIQNWKKTL